MMAPPPVPPEEWRGRFLELRPEDEDADDEEADEPAWGCGTPWEDPLPGCGWRGAEEEEEEDEVEGRSCNKHGHR